MAMLMLFIMVIVLMIIGVPIAISLGASSIVFLLVHSDASLGSIAQTLLNAFTGHYTLLAIPFFILASSFMATGGVAKRIIRFAIALVGSLRGGLAMASVVACMMFAALSGSSPATVVAIGGIVIAGMVKNGYNKEFAAGVICNAGTLGILIPPSIVMVVYAAATDVSVYARYKNIPAQPFVGWLEVFNAAKGAGWGLLLIVIILGGIYGGVFTPTEAAAVAAVYAFIISNFIYKDMGPLSESEPEEEKLKPYWLKAIRVFSHEDTRRTLYEAGKLTIMLMFIVANALILKHVLTEERIPQMITESMLSAGLGPIEFLIVVNLLLLIGGQFMEPSGLLIIVAPLVFPIAIALGIDPIHLGIMMVVNMEIGMITPPVGLNLFVTAGVAKISMMKVVKASLPLVGVMFLFLIIVTYVPAVSVWLPTLMMGPEIITN